MKTIATILFALAAGGGAAWYWPSHRPPAAMRLPGTVVAGNFLTLLVINVPFVLAALGVGLMISAKAHTREEAGYIFPTESMPAVLQPISTLLPTTWMINAARGVTLRGAGWPDLWRNAAVLSATAAVFLTLAGVRFQKRA